ncbi:ABC transporter permease [Desulfosarcina ovata]|uniref:Ribose ABC transporter permease n=1 Tax=Desulfosarcina ovata subsp. ovata TaxID=2752305 RepID=A0A5K8A8P1_9BACT|nr:ABC transporter permease [Desulfosarcina ovata]BBO88420.1 ribose ABC transporter permease [Desulfosarcina ovata subsp. ovata]
MIPVLLHRFKIQAGVSGLLMGLLAVFMIASPATFLGPRIYISFASTIPFVTILALGLTFLVIAGELDLSFPAVMAMSGLTFADVFLKTQNPLLGWIAALVVGAFAGYLNGLLIVRIGVPSIIATIGTQFFWRGLSSLLADGLARSMAPVRETWLHHVFVGRIGGVLPAQALWCLGIALLLMLILNRHIFGDHVLFIGDDIRTARLMGINTDRVRILLFTFMGTVSAFVSVMVCMEMANWWPTQGEGYLLLVFAAIFIGGTSVFGGEGTIYGTLIGAVIIGIIEAGIISAGFSGFWTRLVHGFIIVASVSVYATLFKTGR